MGAIGTTGGTGVAGCTIKLGAPDIVYGCAAICGWWEGDMPTPLGTWGSDWLAEKGQKTETYPYLLHGWTTSPLLLHVHPMHIMHHWTNLDWLQKSNFR